MLDSYIYRLRRSLVGYHFQYPTDVQPPGIFRRLYARTMKMYSLEVCIIVSLDTHQLAHQVPSFVEFIQELCVW